MQQVLSSNLFKLRFQATRECEIIFSLNYLKISGDKHGIKVQLLDYDINMIGFLGFYFGSIAAQ